MVLGRFLLLALLLLQTIYGHAARLTILDDGSACGFQWDWYGNESQIEGFRVYLSSRGEDEPFIFEPYVRIVSCQDIGLVYGKHNIWVTAFRGDIESGRSNVLYIIFQHPEVLIPVNVRLEEK